jgi:hypothetical protein
MNYPLARAELNEVRKSRESIKVSRGSSNTLSKLSRFAQIEKKVSDGGSGDFI